QVRTPRQTTLHQAMPTALARRRWARVRARNLVIKVPPTRTTRRKSISRIDAIQPPTTTPIRGKSLPPQITITVRTSDRRARPTGILVWATPSGRCRILRGASPSKARAFCLDLCGFLVLPDGGNPEPTSLVGLSRAFPSGLDKGDLRKEIRNDPSQHLDRGRGCDSPVARCHRRDDTKGAANSPGQ